MSKQKNYEKESAQLRQKISSKITVSTFLAGFNFTALTFVLTTLSDKNEVFLDQSYVIYGEITITNAFIFECVAAMFLISAALFVAAVYCYDRLLMPRDFWKPGTGSIRFYRSPEKQQEESCKDRLKRWHQMLHLIPSYVGMRTLDLILSRSYSNYRKIKIKIPNYEWEFISDLRHNHISEKVIEVFDFECLIKISETASLKIIEQDISREEWEIEDKKRSIIIYRQRCEKPDYTYSNITKDIQVNLNRGIVTGNLAEFITANDVQLDENRTVQIKEKDKIWLLFDKNKVKDYLLEKNNDDLDFYPYEVKVKTPIEKLAQVRSDSDRNAVNNDVTFVYFLMILAWLAMFIPATISSTIGILLMLFALTTEISIFIFIGICLFVFFFYQMLKPRLGTD